MVRTYSVTVTTPAAAWSVPDRPFVSLLSDFGLRDPSAGIMRAVVLRICPRAIVVDLSHGVDKFAIRDAALLLWSAVPYLPIGTHVAVVDPGVGTARLGIAVRTLRGDVLIGPDNGLLMPAAARLGGIVSAHVLENPRYRLSPTSSSFHGRDVFAPAAAHLAARVPITELGRDIDPRRLEELVWPRPDIRDGYLSGQAVYLDSFGNVKLSALLEDIQAALPGLRHGERLDVRIAGDGRPPRDLSAAWAETFGGVATGAPLLTVDSYGRIMLALNQGSAVASLDVRLDDMVHVRRPPRGGAVPPAPASMPPVR